MASTKLWGVFSVLLTLMGSHMTRTMDLFPAPRPIREDGSRRQMMLVPSFVQQAASPTMFFVGGNERARQHFRPVSSEATGSSEEKAPPPPPPPPRQMFRQMVRPPHFEQEMRSSLTRVTTPPRSEQMGRIVHRPDQIRQQRPFDIRTAAATPERPSFNPPTFFIEDGLPFPPMFELPSRHFQQTNLRQSPPRMRPTTTAPAPAPTMFDVPHRHFEQFRPPPSPQQTLLQTRPSTARPSSPAFEVPPRHFEHPDLRQFRPPPPPPSPQMRPTTTRPEFEVPPRHFEQFRPSPPLTQTRPTTTRPTSPGREFEEPPRRFEHTDSQEFRPSQTRPTTSRPTSPAFERPPPPRHFEQTDSQQFRPSPTRPTTNRPLTSPPRQLEQTETRQPRPRPTSSSPQRRPSRPRPSSPSPSTPSSAPPQAETHILPSVLDSLHGDDVSIFIPGEAGRDYPLFADAPRTRFVCSKEMVSNFVADVETQCQVVRVCRDDGEVDNFLCPNGTLFDDDSQFCNWWYRVPCGENADSNQIPHRGRNIAQDERENQLRQKPEAESRPRTRPRPRPQPQRPSSDEGKADHGLDGFFSRHPPRDRPIPQRGQEAFAVGGIPRTRFEFENENENEAPQSQEGFFKGNLDDFFGHPRLVDDHAVTVQTSTRETQPTSIATTTTTTTVVVPSTIVITTARPRTRTKPTRKQRTRKPFPTRAPTAANHVNVEAVRTLDQSDVGSIGGFGLAVDEQEDRPTTRRPIATVRNRGRATFRPQQIDEVDTEVPATTLPGLKGEFDPFFDEQSRDLDSETTTVTDPPTTRKKASVRRTTTTTTRKPTRKSKTKLTPSTTRFRHRSTKRPRVKPTTSTTTSTTTTTTTTSIPTTTTTEEPATVVDDWSVSPSAGETERPLPRKIAKFSDGNLEVEHFTGDPLSAEPEVRTSPFSITPKIQQVVSSTPVNFDPFYFGPAVTRDSPGPVSLDELPVAGVLPEDTIIPTQGDVATTRPPKLRTSKRRGKSGRKNRVSTSTTTAASDADTASVSTAETVSASTAETVSASTAKSRGKSRSRSRSRSRSKSRSRKTTTTPAAAAEGDDAPSSTERVFATPRSRAQLFPTRHSLMKKTMHTSTVVSEVAEEAQESNTISVAATTEPVIGTNDVVTVT